MAIVSALAKALKELPEGAYKASSLPNLLKKSDVKQEELDFAKLDIPEEGKVTKDELLDAEANRADKFGKQEAGNTYQSISLKGVMDNPTYKENVYTLSDKGAVPKGESRYTSEHYPGVPNYLMHTRTYEDMLDGVYTHIVQEIQSDLHQAGRQRGYDNYAVDELRKLEYSADNPAVQDDAVLATAERLGFNLETFSVGTTRPMSARESAGMWANIQAEALGGQAALGAPTSPFERTWLRKGLEREVESALASGKDQVAIPISGSLKSLKRSEGVQKWYETQVADTAQKLAKSAGMEFKLVEQTSAANRIGPTEEFRINFLRQAIAARNTNKMDLLYDELRYRGEEDLIKQMTRVPVEQRVDVMTKYYQDAAAGKVTFAVLKRKAAPDAKLIEDIMASSKSVDQKAAELRKLGLDDKLTSNVLLGSETAQSAAKRSTNPSFSLYASPAATSVVIYSMLQEGYSKEEVDSVLKEQGVDEAELAEAYKLADAVKTMRAENYDIEEIQPLLEQQETMIGDVQSKPISDIEPPDEGLYSNAYRDLTGNEKLSPKELVAKLETVFPDMSSVTTNVAGLLGNQEAARISEEAVAASRARIVEEANSRGLALEWNAQEGEWMANTEYGQVVVTPEWYKSFWEAKGELTGGIGGVVAGLKAGRAASGAMPHPLAKLAIIAGSTIAGGALGAAGGTELDYLHSAMVLQTDLEAEVAARKAMTAAELSVIGDAVGAGVVKVAGKTWRRLKKAKDFIRDNIPGKAHAALKETMFITDDEASELVAKLAKVVKPTEEKQSAISKVVEKVLGTGQTDSKIQAVALTKPGGETIVEAVAETDPRASRAVVQAIDARAKDVLASTKELAGDDIGRWVQEDLGGYKTLVKEDFERVKTAAAASPRANAFKFNYDKLAIDPVLSRLANNIENKDLAFKFARQSMRIKELSRGRRLPDLIELRKLVNEFRYNNRVAKVKDYEMLDGIKAGIDKAIEQGAYQTMDDPKAWLSAWRASNKAYSEMKALEKNALMKVLTKPGVSEDVLGKALVKYAGATDSTFVDVLAKMPRQTRTKVEGTVLNLLADKYTAGLEGGQRAVNFPMLEKELNGVTFTSPEARSMKKALQQLASVFRNDVPLSQVTGRIQIPQFQSYLTMDPKTRAGMAAASGIFNYIKSFAPTHQGRALALVKKTAQVLENPLHSKSIKELQEMLGGEVELTKELEALVTNAARQQSTGGGMPRVKLYGDGRILATSGNGAERSVPMHLIATTETIKQLAERSGVNRADRKALDIILKEHGYKAAQLGANKVRLLGD